MIEGINLQAPAFTAYQPQEQDQRFGVVTPNSEHEEKVTDTRQVRTLPGQQEVGADGRKRDSVELSQEAEEIRQLQARDREVRAHEAAHASTGGSYAGAPSYTFERGPDGQIYAVGGEVSIDVSPISGDPLATLQKAQQVRAAALAPAEPSSQDMKVAQRAQAMAAEARTKLSSEKTAVLKDTEPKAAEVGSEGARGENDFAPADVGRSEAVTPENNVSSGFSRLDIHA